MRWILLAGLGAATVAGCATSGEIQSNAYAHEERARFYESHGDYYAAARERAAADKQFAKAQRRAYEEAYYGGAYGPYWF